MQWDLIGIKIGVVGLMFRFIGMCHAQSYTIIVALDTWRSGAWLVSKLENLIQKQTLLKWKEKETSWKEDSQQTDVRQKRQS